MGEKMLIKVALEIDQSLDLITLEENRVGT
jgi:hypothetical protein